MSSEAAPLKGKTSKAPNIEHIAKLIEDQVAHFNGWAISEEQMRRRCWMAAESIIRYLRRAERL